MIPWFPSRLATVLPDDRGDPRIAASLRRLQAADYDAEPVLRDGATGTWPGDYPGRLILALSRLASVTGEEPRRLRQLVDGLPGVLNAHGHLGPVHREAVDEQQLAGHGWLVSGLLAHHGLTGEDHSRVLALDIAYRLLLPAATRAPDYPRRRPGDDSEGQASGMVVGRSGRWLLSSDTYCVFIALEGLVAAYAHTRDLTLAAAIETLAALVVRDDLRGARAQLHATLTAARCLHAFHELSGSASALEAARELYELYAAHGRTANHATWNWFGRPDSWTEPCAVTDSLILALGLWRTTREPRYLDDAHAIEHNGLGHAQKAHGGFGLDTTTGPGRPWLTGHHPDAAWCCSMRGAVGLAELRERGYSLPGPGPDGVTTLSVDLYRDGTHRLALPGGPLVLRQRTTYPTGGRTVLDVVESGLREPLRIVFTLPSWTGPTRTVTTWTARGPVVSPAPGELLTVPAAGDSWTVDFPVGPRVRDAGDGEAVALHHGTLLLGAEGAREEDAGAARWFGGAEAAVDGVYRRGGVTLAPVRDVFTRGPGAARYRSRVVFDAPPGD
ncbi:hypothetical protein ACPXCP_06870 [Streptomyces sp. DT20]|uniref:hypothetical protein n=1 Tax=Streptomyces sp. DT20 TaxID=3416519 RepID=UPI003CF970E7